MDARRTKKTEVRIVSKDTPQQQKEYHTRSPSMIYSSRYSFMPAFVTGGIGVGFFTATTKPFIVVCPLHAKHGQSLKAVLAFGVPVTYLFFFWNSSGARAFGSMPLASQISRYQW
jgi:hypothetical protein